MPRIRIVQRLIVAGGVTLAVFAALVTGASAQVDPSGVWAGKATCQRFYDGQPFKESFPDENLQIERSGDDLHMLFFGVQYNGQIIDDADNVKKAEAGMIACSARTEVARLKFTIAAKSASFKATSVYTVGPPGNPTVATCTWTFKRTSLSGPAIGPCP